MPSRELMEAIQNYVMPEVQPGQMVIWYRTGRRDPRALEIGFVIHSGGRTVSLYTSRQRRVDAVRHVDDPKLNLSVEQREQGAWDFAPEEYRLRRLEEAVSQLTDTLNKIIKSGVRAKDVQPVKSPLAEYHELRRRAKELGLDVSRTATRKELIELIESKQEPGEVRRDVLVEPPDNYNKSDLGDPKAIAEAAKSVSQ